MNIIDIKFMRNSFEVSSVAATMLTSGWWPLGANCFNDIHHNGTHLHAAIMVALGDRYFDECEALRLVHNMTFHDRQR